MIRLSKIADYGVVVLAHLAAERGKLRTAAALSGSTFLPEPTVAKVLKLLAKAKIIRSVRGVNGGYVMEKDPHTVSVADVIIALDGPIALTACVEGEGEGCLIKDTCGMNACWKSVNRVLVQSLQNMPFTEMLKTQGKASKTKDSRD